MNKPIVTDAEVLDLVRFGNAGHDTGFYALRLTPPAWENWRSGQFVMLRPHGQGMETITGRPFSICRMNERGLVLFFQVVGRVTELLASLAPGAKVTVWGPLGNSLAVEPKVPTLLLAGGIGIAPFVGYAQNHPTPSALRMEFAHRLPLACYPFDSVQERITAESHLEKKPEDRENFLQRVDRRIEEHAGGLVLACGPEPFLRHVQKTALACKARAQLCLETRMACGVGACLGCVVKAGPPDGEKVPAQTCTCGPNFWADSVSL